MKKYTIKLITATTEQTFFVNKKEFKEIEDKLFGEVKENKK